MRIFYTLIFLCTLFFAKGQSISGERGVYSYWKNDSLLTTYDSLKNGDSIRIKIIPNSQCYFKRLKIEDEIGNVFILTSKVYAHQDSAYLYYEYVHDASIVKIEVTFDSVLPWDGTYTLPHKTKDNRTYRIYRPEELAWFSHKTRSSDTFCFSPRVQLYIMNDFDLGGNAIPPKEWLPIGNTRTVSSKSVCKGDWGLHGINGQNKRIYNIYINRPNDTAVGLISCAEAKYVGSLPPLFMYLDRGIDNWHIVNGLIVGKSAVGGLVGVSSRQLAINHCSNGATVKALENRAGGIIGGADSVDLSLMFCINFGDIYGQSEVGGINGGVIRGGRNTSARFFGIVNWGRINILPGAQGPSYSGGGGGVVIAIGFYLHKGFFNMGLLPTASEALITGTFSGKYRILSPENMCHRFFSDYSLSPTASSFVGEMDSLTASNTPFDSSSNGIYPTSTLIDSAYMRQKMKGNLEFTLEDGFYPRPYGIDERVGRLAASPLVLAPGENVLGVYRDFYVDTSYGVRWECESPGIVSIEGNRGLIQIHAKDTVVRLHAYLQGFSKHVYLTVKARSFFEKSIDSNLCAGDSCFWGGAYRKEEGVYRDTLYRSKEHSMDTIFILNLRFYLSSPTNVEVEILRTELPYSFGGKSYASFGEDTLRYISSHGCDSIIYFSLKEKVAKFTIRIASNAGGKVAPVGDLFFDRGDSLRVFWQADTCSVLDALFIDNHIYPSQGQGSYLFSNINANHDVRFFFTSDSIRLDIVNLPEPYCAQEFLHFKFRVKEGQPIYYDLNFDSSALAQGFVQDRNNIETTLQEVRLSVPRKPYVDTYFASLSASNASGCTSPVYSVPIQIHYPAQDVVRQKWKDVLAVRNEAFNGGYSFKAFQWIQDDKLLVKDTLFRLFQPEGLRASSVYRVLLRREDGTVISSCPIVPKFEELSKLKIYPNPIKEDGNIYVEVEDCSEKDCGCLSVFDVQGKEILRAPLQGGVNRFSTTLKQGMYVLEIVRENVDKQTLKLIVVK